MNSRELSDELLDIRLQHTLKNWVARKEAPANLRKQLLNAALHQDSRSKSGDFIKRNLGWLFDSKNDFSEQFVFPGYGYALDTVYVIRASMTVA